MGVLELIQQKAFLGKEFLTWLWYRAESDPTFRISNSRQCEIEVLAPLTLEANYGDARVSVLRGNSPSTAPEAATALMEGKKARKLRLKLMSDGVDWTCTLDGENFDLSGLNLPRHGQLPFDELLRLRVEYALDFESMLGELFALFLDLRLDAKRWAKENAAIQKWVEGK